jgi:Phage integrase family
VQKWLSKTLARAGLTDAAGQPVRYTHDFRRMFATDAVTGGLPVHIVARLLGHKNLNTTQAYMPASDARACGWIHRRGRVWSRSSRTSRTAFRTVKLNGWLGEVAGLETSLNEAARKLISLDRTTTAGRRALL